MSNAPGSTKPAVQQAVRHYYDNDTLGYNLETIAAELAPGPGAPVNWTSWIPPLVIVSGGANVATPLGTGATPVKNAIIQNISANAVTLGSQNVTAGNGFILNGASSAGNAGDAVTVGPQGDDDYLDLSQIWCVQSGTGNSLSVLVLA